jgi:hypothetical protein
MTFLPDESDPWHGPQGDGNEFASFQDSTDEEIAILQEFLHKSSLPPDQLIDAIDEETLFDSDSSDSDDKWDGDGQFVVPGAKITKHPMRSPTHDFNLDDASEQAHLAFCELSNTPEFQSISPFREQISVAVDYMRTDSLSIAFSQMAGIFRGSKGTIIKHYQRGQSESKCVGRPTAVNDEIWTHVRYSSLRSSRQAMV